MEGGQRWRRGKTDDMFIPHTTYPISPGRKKVEVINNNGHAANRMYVVRSNPPPPDPYRALNLTKFSLPKPSASNSDGSLFSGRELKRRKRVAKYKWYAIEGRVKASVNNGYSWFKRRCSRIVHGV